MVKSKRSFLMGRADRLLLGIIVIIAAGHGWAHAGDVKTQLWSGVGVAAFGPDLSIKCGESGLCYPWKLAIVSTVFWVGETGSGPANTHSAWEQDWVGRYGGVDDPVRRKGYEPAGFRPHENPFYVALPYCDMEDGT